MVRLGVNLNMVILRHRRAFAVAAVVAFNVLMLVLAATGPTPIETPLVVAWIVGDAVVSLMALTVTEES